MPSQSYPINFLPGAANARRRTTSENRFFQEDFDELKAAGYLRMAIPREFGGPGLNLAEVGRETRKLAMYAPATALALNMHHYWVGDAADACAAAATSRSSGFSRKRQPEKCSPPGTPSMATTSPACCRRPRQRK